MAPASQERYSTVAVILHWAIAALVVANVLLGWQFEDMRGPDRRALMGVHKALGMSILLLMVARVAWRALNKPPPRAVPLSRIEAFASRTVHTALYVLLIALPLTGWATVSSGREPGPIDMFGLFHVPPLDYFAGMERHARRDVHEVVEEAHHVLVKVIVYGLVPLHILGALKHQFIDRENELGRMIPFLGRR